MDIIYNEKIKRLMQKDRIIHVKIESLDWEENVIAEITGKALKDGGTISVTNSNMVRRQCNFQFLCDKQTDIKEGSPFWINKKIRILIGLDNISTGEIQWFSWGIYVMSNPSKDISLKGNILSIQGYDKMHIFSLNMFNWETTLIPVDTPMHECIKAIGDLQGETKYKIENTGYVTPYDQEIDPTETLIDRMQKEQEMYMDYQIHYDVDGYLTYESTYTKETDPVYWTFSNDTRDLEISRKINFDFDNVKNYIKVFGYYDDDTGKQPSYLLQVPDDDEFSESKIGHRRSVSIVMDDYTREDQCKLYAEYVLKYNYKLGKQIVITCVPLYFLNNVNVNIEVYDENKRYICCVDDITCPVGDGTMTITCHVIAEYDVDNLYADTVHGLYNSTVDNLYNRNVGDIGKSLY